MNSKYSFKITRNGALCSEHKSLASARKQRSRLVYMSRGKLKEEDFKIEPIPPAATPDKP